MFEITEAKRKKWNAKNLFTHFDFILAESKRKAIDSVLTERQKKIKKRRWKWNGGGYSKV